VAEQLLEVRGQLAFGPPKTGAGLRTVTLPAVAAEALAEHLSRYAEVGPDGLVFPGRTGRPNPPQQLHPPSLDSNYPSGRGRGVALS
jgi:hypothetical protein